nr:hypothetical protein Iba_chr09cCG8320 [Ipomoea batatas]
MREETVVEALTVPVAVVLAFNTGRFSHSNVTVTFGAAGVPVLPQTRAPFKFTVEFNELAADGAVNATVATHKNIQNAAKQEVIQPEFPNIYNMQDKRKERSSGWLQPSPQQELMRMPRSLQSVHKTLPDEMIENGSVTSFQARQGAHHYRQRASPFLGGLVSYARWMRLSCRWVLQSWSPLRNDCSRIRCHFCRSKHNPNGIILALMEARTKGSVVEFPGNEQICDSALREHKLVRLFAKRGRGVGKNAGTEIVMETLFYGTIDCGIILALMEARTKGSVVEFPGNEQICDSALREHKLVRLFAKRGRGVGKNAGTEIVMETLFMVPLIVVLKTPRTLFINKGRHTNATVEFTNGGGPVELPQSRAPVRFSVIDRSRPNPWAVDAGVTAMIATHTNTKRLAEE